jgi:hypothetical protein
VATDEELAAAGISDKEMATYKLYQSQTPPMSWPELAEHFGCAVSTVKRHLAIVRRRLMSADAVRGVGKPGAGRKLENRDPDRFASAVVEISAPDGNLAAACRRSGLDDETARAVRRRLQSDLAPLGREIKDVKLSDMVRRLGTLAQDAVDAITPEKLAASSARDLAVVMGVATDKWQLLRGQPTQRTEINDRREMNEVMKLILEEAKRRKIEIDITPDGEVLAKPSPYRNMADQKLQLKIRTGDPAETWSPA